MPLYLRRTSTTDGRARVVALTPRGQHVVDDLIAKHLRNDAALLSRLSETKQAQLADLLGEFASALESAGVEE